MRFNNKYPMFLLYFLSIIGSLVVSSIVMYGLELNVFLSVIAFILCSAFLITITYKGTIRYIDLGSNFLSIKNSELIEFNYKDIKELYIVTKHARKLKPGYYTKEIDLKIITSEDNFIVPYDMFKTCFYDIISTVYNNNNEVFVDNIFYVCKTKEEFDDILYDIHKCKIKPFDYLNNPDVK